MAVNFKHASQLNDAVLAGVCAGCLCVYPEYLLIPHAGPLQFFELFAPADGALFLFRNRPALFAGAGRFAITEPLALAGCVDVRKILYLALSTPLWAIRIIEAAHWMAAPEAD